MALPTDVMVVVVMQVDKVPIAKTELHRLLEDR